MEKPIFISDEFSPLSVFEDLSKETGASWNGEEFYMDNSEYGVMKSILYSYSENIHIGVTELNLKQESIFINQPKHDEKYISIRIGKVGSFNDETSLSKSIKDSIYIYNHSYDFTITYPKNVQMSWLFIRFPIDEYKLLSADKTSNFYHLINNPKSWFFYSPMLPKVEQILKEVYHILQQKEIRRAYFLSKSIELVTQLRVYNEQNDFKNIAYNIHPKDLSLMIEIKDYLLNDYTSPPVLDNICSTFGLSESKLQRTFKKVFQQPILQFFNLQRVLEAKRLIKNTEKDLTQIAIELGFSDISHFSKSYKKYIGIKPSDERTQHQDKKVQ
ncbi:helix-turn-helix domain-containing protein [Flammeovirga kamogawensis]|uniref:Helix-turn-helix transcriptional regulator n=1 Tax=Flammeovirga kamogawensis TaxID=373891 RepID=A0ABX8H4P3_9BACT|nr:AraC family transcriptional regulator [Flammeovirga kamogawensis]MBB6463532.1 AraC-like DNA-binding protein [Flammeovirga kamogawensis]QWG10589.1 helix-turn-helix transcriptional regulator [Flammeovirga kamogawensis]TRX63695.1 helix-turn-helix transcriptional regulator [Flammeovirga kamogawensis]